MNEWECIAVLPVTRYIETYDGCEEDPQGDYVTFEDYTALKTLYESTLTAQLTADSANAELRTRLSETESFALAARTAETLDAERYRYLRNAAGQYLGEEDGPSVCSGLSDLFQYHFGPVVDEVVDAAIARWKAAGCPMPGRMIIECEVEPAKG